MTASGQKRPVGEPKPTSTLRQVAELGALQSDYPL